MQAYGQTDTGCVRTRNQDYIYFSPEQTGDLENLFFLADGMGGDVKMEKIRELLYCDLYLIARK